MNVKGYSCSVIGGREMNQDSFLVNDEKGLYAVADGVGGGMGGEIASRMAIEGLSKQANSFHELRAVILDLQAQVYKYAMDNYGEAIMGTTLTSVMVKDQKAHIAHVGDSHCYLFSGGVLRLLTEDHEFYDENLQGTILASYLGIPQDVHPLKIFEEQVDLVPGNRLLICSDGLYRQLSEARIAALIREKGNDAQALVDQLAQEASTKEHSDNVTIVLVLLD